MIGERTIYSVTDINRYIKSVISQDENLKFISIKGELSNFKRGANGHLYFSLKDKESLINCAMFSTYASKLIYEPKDGDEVLVMASVDVYPARGSYQLIVYEMNGIGQGEQLIKLEMLKKALAKEGLFDESRKREITIFPRAVGVITAKNGAAIKDIVHNINRRFPLCKIYFFPSSVQGESAPKELLEAFNRSQQYDLDTLIIGRGGGASEDLSAFNDEKLVRAIATSKMPVIAAVGHEIDVTLVDYVADKRASTPTGAAELATVDIREIRQKFQYALDDMKESIKNKLEDYREDLSSLSESLQEVIKDKIEYLANEINSRKLQLEALNPKNVLNRGYSITTSKDGKVIVNTKDIKIGEQIVTNLKDGKIVSIIDKVEE